MAHEIDDVSQDLPKSDCEMGVRTGGRGKHKTTYSQPRSASPVALEEQ